MLTYWKYLMRKIDQNGDNICMECRLIEIGLQHWPVVEDATNFDLSYEGLRLKRML